MDYAEIVEPLAAGSEEWRSAQTTATQPVDDYDVSSVAPTASEDEVKATYEQILSPWWRNRDDVAATAADIHE